MYSMNESQTEHNKFTSTSVNKKNFREKENIRERGTKRYRERLIEEKEGEKTIREYEEQLEKDDETDKTIKPLFRVYP